MKQYIKVVDGEPQRVSPLHIRKDFPRISFPEFISDELFAHHGYLLVAGAAEPAEEATSTVERGDIVFMDGTWVQLWVRVAIVPPTLLERRVASSLTRPAFLTALVKASILTPDDALAAFTEWPTPMQDFLAYLNVEQQFDLQLLWKAAGTIERNNTFILSLGSYLGLTDQQLDALFGIS